MRNTKIIVRDPGNIGSLVLEMGELPVPEVDQVRIKVEAAGAAYGDVFLRRGIGYRRSQYPLVPGYDVLGIVDLVGHAVSELAVGDRVAGLPVTGGYQSYLCLRADEVVRVPEGLDPVKAAAVVLNYTTALQMLTRAASLQPGQVAFIYGIGGVLGQAMAQIAPLLGAQVVGTASGARLRRALDAGETVFDRNEDDLVAKVKAVFPAGLDAVYDPIGGKSLNRSFAMLKPNGTLVLAGSASAVQSPGRPGLAIMATMARYLALKLLSGRRRITIYLIPNAKKTDLVAFRTDLAQVFQWLQAGAITPSIAAILPLAQARKAHAALEEDRPPGKIVLVLDDALISADTLDRR